jgi:predicted nucleotidyltransferase
MAVGINDSQRAALEGICRNYAVKTLKLFGSAARDDFNLLTSDIDLLVEFGDPPPGLRPARQFFGFLEEIEALFGRRVDLLEEHAIENSRLRQSAMASAVTLYAA